MPSYTSTRSGYWSDPATWGGAGVPREGDTVTIAAGHTVIFDTDMSGFPNGLVGLTINGTLLIPSLNDPSYSEVGEDTSGTPWLSGWSYRRTITVDNLTATALSNFQVIIRLNTAYLIQQGKMRSDCGDIRVTDSAGALLSIWIDPATKNTWNTKIYVRVPSIAASARVTLYLFYGNPSATDVSNGAATFDFFDDFLGTSLDTTRWAAARWTGTGTWSVTVNNGYVQINTAAGTRAGIASRTTFPFPFIVEGTFRYISGDQVWISITQTSGGSHTNLVEHGYSGTGGTYFYRRANNGTYTNYQSFARLAPRGIFAYFRQEWATNSGRYFEYLPHESQVNTTTTQDRYTSGNSLIQLSTIGGVAQWDWIAVRKNAATPPAVYFRTLTSTVLRVNANISGTGSIIIGSPTYPISYPQTVTILINGSINVATVQVYGEPQNSFIDFPANPISGYSNSFTLQNGLPLQRFHTIAIGRGDFRGDPWTTYPPADLYFVVESYDAETKTVTVSPQIVNARPTKSLVCLVSRPVTIRRFGTSAGVPLTGSGRTVQGCVVDVQNITNNATTAASSTFANFVAINGRKGASSVLPAITSTFTDVLVVYGQQGWNGVSGISINSAVLLSVSGGLGDNISGSFANIWVQNAQHAFFPSTPTSYTIDTLWAVGVGGVIGIGRADLIKNLTADYADYLFRDGPTLFNVTCGANVPIIFGGLSGSAALPIPNIYGLTLEGTNTSIGLFGLYHDVIIRGLNGNLPTPPNIDNTSLPATSPVKALYFVEWQGFGNYSQARGRYFRHGRVISDVSASPPAPNTFKFYLSETTNIQPIHLDWQFNGGGTIQVTGTITQLGSGESVRVQIFSVDKEPLLGSTPDYEETYTTTGNININWTPPSAGTWIARVLAYPQQTTNPITIQDLQVTGVGAGSGDGGQTYNVNVSDSVTPTLTDSATLTHSLNLSDGITATLSDQATLSAPISLSDSLSPNLSDSANAQVSASVADNVAATLSDSGSVSAAISTSDNIAPTLQDSANLTHSLAVSDSLVPTLSDSAQVSAQVSATDNINPTLSENVTAENVYEIGVSDQITPTLSESATLTNSLNLSDEISATLSDQATLSAPITLSDNLSPTLSDSASAQIDTSATDSISTTLSDSGAISTTISASDSIAPTLQDSADLIHNLDVSDSLAPTLSDSAQMSAQLSATDSIAPTLSENVTAGNVYEIGISDQVTPALSDDATLTSSLSLSDGISATLSDQAILDIPISLSDSVAPNLSDSASTQVDTLMSDTITATLSDSGAVSAQITTSDAITPTLQDAASLTYEFSVADSLAPTLSDSAQTSAQVSTTDSIAPTLNENVSVGNVYEIGISDQITSTLSDSGTIVGQIDATDTITPTLSDNVTSGNIYEIGVSDQVTPTLSDSGMVTGQITATETITPTLQDSGGAQVQITQTETISPTIQEAPSVGAALSVSDTVTPTLQDSGQVSAQIAATETMTPTLQENVTAGNVYNVGISDGITATLNENVSEGVYISPVESITPTLQDGSAIQTQITHTEVVTPTLQDAAQPSIQVSATESMTSTLQESVAAVSIYNVGISDGVAATLSETVSGQASIAATDSIAPTLTENAFAGNIYEVRVTDNVSPSLTENIAKQVTVSTQDTINATLTEQVRTTPQVSVSENITPTLQENVSAPSSYSLSISEQIAPTLHETASMSAQVSATESIQPSLSDSAAISSTYSVAVSDAISPAMTESIAETAQISASESIAPTLGDQAATQIGISSTDTVGVTLQEAAGAAAQVSVSDATNVTLDSSPSASVGATVSETIQPTITEQVSPQATIMAQEVTDITATETAATEVSTSVSESQAVTITDTPVAQPIVSVTEAASLTASEEIRQFSGENYIVVEPLHVNVHGEEIEISVEEERIHIEG